MITIKYNLVPGYTVAGLLLLVVVQCRVGRLMVGVGVTARTRCITSESSNTWGGVRRGGRHLEWPGTLSSVHTPHHSHWLHHITPYSHQSVYSSLASHNHCHLDTSANILYCDHCQWHGPNLSISCDSGIKWHRRQCLWQVSPAPTIKPAPDRKCLTSSSHGSWPLTGTRQKPKQ